MGLNTSDTLIEECDGQSPAPAMCVVPRFRFLEDTVCHVSLLRVRKVLTFLFKYFISYIARRVVNPPLIEG